MCSWQHEQVVQNWIVSILRVTFNIILWQENFNVQFSCHFPRVFFLFFFIYSFYALLVKWVTTLKTISQTLLLVIKHETLKTETELHTIHFYVHVPFIVSNYRMSENFQILLGYLLPSNMLISQIWHCPLEYCNFIFYQCINK